MEWPKNKCPQCGTIHPAITAPEAERNALRVQTRMGVEERCQKYQIQNCHECPSLTCGDNISPLRRERDALRAQLAAANKRADKLIKHCKNCGGDYAVTGLESRCPCLIVAEHDDYAARLRGVKEAWRGFMGEPTGTSRQVGFAYKINALLGGGRE